MKAAILSNDVVPDMGLPCSGQGVRAESTRRLLESVGWSADVLLQLSLVGSRYKRWSEFPFVTVPDYVRLFRRPDARQVLAEYDLIILHNWGGGHQIDALKDVDAKVVYDFFSATLVEHAYLDLGDNHLNEVAERKRRLIALSDGFWANGPGRASYAERFLAGEGKGGALVYNIPMCPRRTANTREPLIVVGGFQQAWTTSLSDELLARIVRTFPSHSVIRLGHGVQYHGIRLDAAQGALGDGASGGSVIDVKPMSFSAYQDILSRAAVFVDVSALNDERRISFSSRGVTALAHGCPIIHNLETDLGTLVHSHGAGVALDEASIMEDDQLVAAIDTCVSQDMRPNTEAAMGALEKACRTNIVAFLSAAFGPERVHPTRQTADA